MSYAATVQAIEDHLSTGWTDTPLIWEGERFDRPDPPSPFVMFAVEADPARLVSFGGKTGGHQRAEARLLLTVFAPVDGGGRGLAREMADRLAALFPPGTPVPGTRFRLPGFGRVLPADGDAGWLSMDVVIPLTIEGEWARA